MTTQTETKAPFAHDLHSLVEPFVRTKDPATIERMESDFDRCFRTRVPGGRIVYIRTMAEHFTASPIAGRVSDDGVANVATVLRNQHQHPLLQSWSEEEKRFLLDVVAQWEISQHVQDVDYALQKESYFEDYLMFERRELLEAKQTRIVQLKTLQKELRERISPAPAPERR